MNFQKTDNTMAKRKMIQYKLWSKYITQETNDRAQCEPYLTTGMYIGTHEG